MKAKKIFILLAAVMLSGCGQNAPEESDLRVLFQKGHWHVVKEVMTNGDGFGGVVTRTENFFRDYDVYCFTECDISIFNSHAILYNVPLVASKYTAHQLDSGKWLLTVPDLFDKERNLLWGVSPITIHKLSGTTMEWEFEVYGGDEGPVVYYQYLKYQPFILL